MRGISLNAYAELQIIKQLRIDVFFFAEKGKFGA